MASERSVCIWDKELGKTLRAHRVAAEQALGRSLEPGEVVHHVNGDRNDNRADHDLNDIEGIKGFSGD